MIHSRMEEAELPGCFIDSYSALAPPNKSARAFVLSGSSTVLDEDAGITRSGEMPLVAAPCLWLSTLDFSRRVVAARVPCSVESVEATAVLTVCQLQRTSVSLVYAHLVHAQTVLKHLVLVDIGVPCGRMLHQTHQTTGLTLAAPFRVLKR